MGMVGCGAERNDVGERATTDWISWFIQNALK